MRTGSWTGPPRGKRARRVGIASRPQQHGGQAPAPRGAQAVLLWPQRNWYGVTEQPAPAPHLAHPEECAALRIALVTVPCLWPQSVARSPHRGARKRDQTFPFPSKKNQAGGVGTISEVLLRVEHCGLDARACHLQRSRELLLVHVLSFRVQN